MTDRDKRHQPIIISQEDKEENETDWRDALSPAISAATLSAEETSFVSESITMQNEENKDD